MKIILFKTNIENQTMIQKLAAVLNTEELISKWEIDINTPEKILSVSGEEITPGIITNAIKAAGFEIELLRIFAIKGHDL